MSVTAPVLLRGPGPEVMAPPRNRLIAPATWRWLRIAAVSCCLVPITALIGLRLARWSNDPLLTVYGLLVLLLMAKVMFVSFAFYRDPARRGTRVVPPAGAPLVSLLVACKDDVDVIALCVISMIDQSYPNKEIIVVDDGSTDGSYERLRELETENPGVFTLLRNDESIGKKRALVRALEGARGEYLIFTDSDCLLDDEAVAQVARAFAHNPDVGAVSGDARALNADHNLLTRIQDTWYDGQFSIWKAAESVFGSVSCVSGPLAGFRREAVWNYFPAWAADQFLGREFRFATDRQLTGYVLGQEWKGEKLKAEHADSAFVKDVDYPARRWRIEYVRSAMVWTNVPESMRSMVRQQTAGKRASSATWPSPGTSTGAVVRARACSSMPTRCSSSRRRSWPSGT